MPSRRTGHFLLLCLLSGPAGLTAQTSSGTPRSLTLAQALELAKQNSPTYRQVLNDADPASAAVRAAKGGMLPTVSTNAGVGYTGSGRSTFGGSFFNQTSPTMSSSYSINADWQLNARTFMEPAQARANERATEHRIGAAAVTLTFDVTTQYLNTLRAAATVEVARQQVDRNREFLELARARYQVGQANLLDVRQAEVTTARADVQLIQAQQQHSQAKIELLRRIGLSSAADIDSMRLTEAFALAEPRYELEALRAQTHSASPELGAAAATREAAAIGVRAARSEYLPSLSVSTGLSGFTQQFTNENALLNNALGGALSNRANCEFQNDILRRLSSPHPAPGGGIIADCNAFAGLDAAGAQLLPENAQSLRESNSVFPFNFTRQPWSIRVGVSLPIWDGWQRSQRISQARAQEDDAREQVRALELAIDGQVHATLLSVRTAWATARIQDTNRGGAREQLQLARDRYRLGLGTALELADAQNAVTQTEADYVTAIYDYHLAVAGLEAAVGRPLR